MQKQTEQTWQIQDAAGDVVATIGATVRADQSYELWAQQGWEVFRDRIHLRVEEVPLFIHDVLNARQFIIQEIAATAVGTRSRT